MDTVLKQKFNELMSSDISHLPVSEQINQVVNLFDAVVFSTSFSKEDQLITHLVHKHKVNVFTLDTGRLFEQTYETWNLTRAKYGINIQAFVPSANELQAFLNEKGPNSFYQSVENRKQCCSIRKVIPLKSALKEQQIWITGLRAEHSPERKNLNVFEWDDDNQIIKFHPLLHWTSEEINEAIKANGIPYNKLHDKGFVSIGCEPCTRAIKIGEDFRAGRWWWEDQSKKECGLHSK